MVCRGHAAEALAVAEEVNQGDDKAGHGAQAFEQGALSNAFVSNFGTFLAQDPDCKLMFGQNL